MSIRAEKVAGEIQKILSQPVTKLAEEHSAGLATVTSVRITEDLHIARVYVSCYGGKTHAPEFVGILEQNAGELRTIVAKNMRLRYIPELKYYVDDTLDQISHIQSLLDSVKKKGS